MNPASEEEALQACAASQDERALTRKVMEAVVEPSNLNRAYRRVKANRGSPGVDGMSVGELGDWCRANKHELVESLLAGRYRPQPIRGVEIPKPGGGMRQLGIPALKAITSRRRGISLERMIEQINARASGWVRYFALAHYGGRFRELDRWLRRRLRCMRLKQCKRAIGIARFLLARGLSRPVAWTLALSGKGWWRLANTPQASRAMPMRWFDTLGLLSLQAQHAALLTLRKPPDTLSMSGGVGGRPG